MDPHVRHLIESLACNYRQVASVRQMAAWAGLSTSRMAHLFKRDTGVSPGAYLKRLRMAKACELLRSTGLLVKEIMLQTGFNDASHFVRDFTRLYGETPENYRGRHRKDLLQLSFRFDPADSANGKQKRPTDRD